MPDERDPRLVQLAQELINEDLRQAGVLLDEDSTTRQRDPRLETPAADLISEDLERSGQRANRTSAPPAEETRGESTTISRLIESVKELVRSFAKLFRKSEPNEAPSPTSEVAAEPAPQPLSAFERVRQLSDEERAVVAAEARDKILGNDELRAAYLDGKLPNAGKLAATGALPGQPEPYQPSDPSSQDSSWSDGVLAAINAQLNAGETTNTPESTPAPPREDSRRNSTDSGIGFAAFSEQINRQLADLDAANSPLRTAQAAKLTAPGYNPNPTPSTNNSTTSPPPASPVSPTSSSGPSR